MFGIFRCIRRNLLPTILICVFITFCPGIPPNATYLPYGNSLKPSQKLTPDTTLNNAERLLEGQLVGPEAFAVHKGSLYAGLHGGNVVKILPNKIIPVVKTGKDCAGIHEEHICGRPLGLRVRNDILYIADAYYGLFSHVIADGPGKLNHLLGPKIEVNGTPVKIFNSVEVDKDGVIYFSSSSSVFDINEGLQALISPSTGRVLKYDPKTKKVTQLLDGLNFANGLALSADEESLFVAECVGRRVLKYHLKTGSVQPLVEGLPGLVDNIQYAGDNTYWVSLVSPSDDEYPALTDVLADWPNIRKFLGRSLFLLELPFKLINQYYPNSFCEMAAYHIGHLGPIMAILPEKVSIVRFDGNTGKILDVLQGTNGAVKSISDVAVVGDAMYLGSPANNFVGRVPLLGNLKGKFAQTEEAAKFKSDSGAQARKAAEEAKARQAAEEAKAKKAAEEARIKKAAEDAKKAAEEAKAKKAAEEAKAKKAAEEAKAKKAAEDAKKAAEDAKAKTAAEEAKAKKAAEDAKAKKAAEDAKKAAEEAKAKAAEEAKVKKAAEEAKAKKAAEESKKAAEAAAKAKSKEAANKKISEEEIKTNKISQDAGKSKVHGDKVKTEL